MPPSEKERASNVAQMRANFAQEGQFPDAEDEGLLARYIDGSATLADLYDHAREYAVAAQKRAAQRPKEQLATRPREDLEKFNASMKACDEEQQCKAAANIEVSDEQSRRQESVSFATTAGEISGLTVSGQKDRNAGSYVVGKCHEGLPCDHKRSSLL